MTLSLIVAMDENRAIGKDNKLLWHLPEDMKHFKNTTMGNIVVMGRKTFESMGSRPLPGRKNIILSSRLTPAGYTYVFDGERNTIMTRDTEIILKYIHSHEIFIIGGQQIYELFLPLADKLYITEVHTGVEGADTFFPEFDHEDFFPPNCRFHDSDEKNPYPMTFTTYTRKY
jgi:dihydrofolate reductase